MATPSSLRSPKGPRSTVHPMALGSRVSDSVASATEEGPWDSMSMLTRPVVWWQHHGMPGSFLSSSSYAARDQRTVRVVRHPNRGRSSPRGIREAGIRVGRSDVLWVRHASSGRRGSSSRVRALRRELIVSTATLAGRSEPFMGSGSRGTCLGDGSGSSTSTPLAGAERRRRNATSVARTRLREVLVLGGRLCSRESSSAVLAPLMRRLRRTLRWLGIGGNIVSWPVVLMTRSMLALSRRTSRRVWCRQRSAEAAVSHRLLRKPKGLRVPTPTRRAPRDISLARNGFVSAVATPRTHSIPPKDRKSVV